MVSSYLVHHGYCATATAFARMTETPIQEEQASIKNRQSKVDSSPSILPFQGLISAPWHLQAWDNQAGVCLALVLETRCPAKSLSPRPCSCALVRLPTGSWAVWEGRVGSLTDCTRAKMGRSLPGCPPPHTCFFPTQLPGPGRVAQFSVSAPLTPSESLHVPARESAERMIADAQDGGNGMFSAPHIWPCPLQSIKEALLVFLLTLTLFRALSWKAGPRHSAAAPKEDQARSREMGCMCASVCPLASLNLLSLCA